MTVRDVLPRDAIPSVDEPRFATGYFGEPDDRVVVVAGDPPRAYPIRILSYHEIVNDAVDGGPVAVTWCPICASAVVYERTVDGRFLEFGTSGSLADDALVMYDRQTGSEWKQPSGTAISGELAGRRLAVRPSAVEPYGRFRADHPDGLVLQPARADARSGQPAAVYDMAPYREYFDRDAFGLYGMRGVGPRRSWTRDDLAAKTTVLGIEAGGDARGYPLPWVRSAGGVVPDTVGDLDVAVVEADGELYAYEDPGHDWVVGPDGLLADGTAWDPVSGESADGRRVARLPARLLFAFAWQDVHGPDAFFEPADGTAQR